MSKIFNFLCQLNKTDKKKSGVKSIMTLTLSALQIVNPSITYAKIPDGNQENVDGKNQNANNNANVENLLLANGAQKNTDPKEKFVKEINNMFRCLQGKTDFKFYEEFSAKIIEKLSYEDSEGNNIFHLFAEFEKDEFVFEAFLDILQNFSMQEKFRTILNLNPNAFYLKKIYEKDKNGLTPRMLAIKNQNLLFLRKIRLAEDSLLGDFDYEESKNEMFYAFKESSENFIKEFIEIQKDNGSKTKQSIANYSDDQGNTLAHVAVKRKSLELLKIFKQLNHFYSNTQNNDGDTPLNLAIKNDCPDDIVSFLIENGADFKIPNNVGESPLISADEKNSKKIFESLLSKVELNERDKNGNTLLHFAVRNKLINLSAFLIEQNLDIFEENNDGETPFSLAQKSDFKDIEKLMLDHIDMDFKKLEQAIMTDSQKDVDDILKSKSIKFLKNKELFHIAIKNNSFKVLDSLLKNPYTLKFIDAINDDGDTPIINAIKNESFDFAKKITCAGADLNLSDKNGETPLTLSVEKGKSDIVELLLDEGANPDLTNRNGETPLTLSIKEDKSDIVDLLLDEGANQNLANGKEEVPLLLAIEKDNLKVVELLIEKGVDPNLFNKNEESFEEEESDIVELLLNEGANQNLAKEKEQVPLLLAIEKDKLEMVELLLEKGAKPNLLNKNGELPLTLAVKEGKSQAIVDALLEKGADYSLPNKDGKTPLDWAKELGREYYFSWLFIGGEEEDSFQEEEAEKEEAEKEDNSRSKRSEKIQTIAKNNVQKPKCSSNEEYEYEEDYFEEEDIEEEEEEEGEEA